MTEPAPRRLVVVPTYDEADNVVRLLDALTSTTQVDVLVVDDSSPDGTGRLVENHPRYGASVHLLTRPGKAGLGAAYRAGFRWALDRGYDEVAQMDADFSHPVESVSALFAALADHDLAVGSRYVRGGGVRDWPLSRRLVSRIGNLYVRLVLGLSVRDATAGFRAFRAPVLEVVAATGTHSNGYCFQIEVTWRADRAGFLLAEVPITFVDRTAGTSKMSTSIALEALTRVLGWRFGELREQPHRRVPRGGRPVTR